MKLWRKCQLTLALIAHAKKVFLVRIYLFEYEEIAWKIFDYIGWQVGDEINPDQFEYCSGVHKVNINASVC